MSELKGKLFKILIGINNTPIVKVIEQNGKMIRVKYVSGGFVTGSLIEEIESSYYDTSLLIRI